MTFGSRVLDGRPAASLSPAALGRLDLLVALGLGLAAFAIRYPWLLTVPRFTDEMLEVIFVVPLYRLQAVPLVGFDPYNGALFTYLLAAVLWLVGPEASAPRLLAALLGSGAVAATYLLGRCLAGRLAGAVAAGLLATSAIHVVVNSHIAWSNATTPFFTTLALLAIMPAILSGSRRALLFGGLAFGLALQTHPSVVALVPGVALALLWRRPGLLRSRYLLAAVALFLLAYGNVLLFNVLPGGDGYYRQVAASFVPGWGASNDQSLSRISQQRQTYGSSGPEHYLSNLGALAFNLPRLPAGPIAPRPNWTEHLKDGRPWIYGAVIVLGLFWPLRQANPLPLLAAASVVALLPLINGKYEPLYSGRYLMPLLPLAFAGFGSLVSDLWQRLTSRGARLAAGVAVATLALYPLMPLLAYEQQAAEEGQINLDLIDSARTVDEARHSDEPVLLDTALGRRNLLADGDVLQVFELMLQLRGVPYRVGPASAGKIETSLGGAQSAVAVLAQPYDDDLEDRYDVHELETRSPTRYAVYRLERRARRE